MVLETVLPGIFLSHFLRSVFLSRWSGTPDARENRQTRGNKVFVPNCELYIQMIYGKSLVAGLRLEIARGKTSESDCLDKDDLLTTEMAVSSFCFCGGSDSQVYALTKML